MERARRGAALIRTVQGPALGGFLALHRLQDEADGGAAVAGIVASG